MDGCHSASAADWGWGVERRGKEAFGLRVAPWPDCNQHNIHPPRRRARGLPIHPPPIASKVAAAAMVAICLAVAAPVTARATPLFFFRHGNAMDEEGRWEGGRALSPFSCPQLKSRSRRSLILSDFFFTFTPSSFPFFSLLGPPKSGLSPRTDSRLLD